MLYPARTQRSGGPSAPPRTVADRLRNPRCTLRVPVEIRELGRHDPHRLELKLLPGFALENVFSSQKKWLDAACAIARPALEDSTFQKWLLKHATAGLGMAKQAKKATMVELFTELIRMLE